MEVSTDITKEDIDQLYHLLRKFSNSHEAFQGPVKDIFAHLFMGPGYCHLLAFSKFYGQKYLLPRAINVIHELCWGDKFKRVVDLGCGRGWLGYGIAHHFKAWPVLVDKRETVSREYWPTSLVYPNVNLETTEGLMFLKEVLGPTDLIVMCDFLHCIDNPRELLEALTPHPMIILEYTSPGNYAWLSSFYHQLMRYNATAYSTEVLKRMVYEATKQVPTLVVMDPYLLLAVEGIQ